jgi:hypothetical protein
VGAEGFAALLFWMIAAGVAFAVFNGLASGRAFGRNGERIDRHEQPASYWLHIVVQCGMALSIGFLAMLAGGIIG